jgi:hypothetical protein
MRGNTGERRLLAESLKQPPDLCKFILAFAYAAFRRLLVTRPGRRFPAALRACLERAFLDAPERPSLFNAFNVACERLREGFCRLELCLALLLLEALPAGGGGSFTPAFRAFESPIAMACLGERTPCLPSRT